MTDPALMIAWIDRSISSKLTWLDDHGPRSKRPRPSHEIEAKQEDVAMLTEIRVAYVKALQRRETAA